jgi:hypothetical protein
MGFATAIWGVVKRKNRDECRHEHEARDNGNAERWSPSIET